VPSSSSSSARSNMSVDGGILLYGWWGERGGGWSGGCAECSGALIGPFRKPYMLEG